MVFFEGTLRFSLASSKLISSHTHTHTHTHTYTQAHTHTHTHTGVCGGAPGRGADAHRHSFSKVLSTVTFYSRYIRALIFENLYQAWQFVATPLRAPSESHSWPHMRDRVVPLTSCTDSQVGREREREREERERERGERERERERERRESSFRFSY
jgi:hypothetical protein